MNATERSGPDGMRPETDTALLMRYRVESDDERLRLLTGLASARAPLALHVGGSNGGGVPARLERVDPGTGSLEIALEIPAEAQSAHRMALHAAGRATGVAIQAGAKLQFTLDGITPSPGAAQSTLRAPMPTTLVRLQRRDAYRVEASPLALPQLRVTEPAAQGPRAVTVTDLSATGLSFLLPTDHPAPRIGIRLSADPLELPAMLPIRCALRVCTVEPEPRGSLRIGCAFEGLEPAAARALQRFVNAAQVRTRTPRPRLR